MPGYGARYWAERTPQHRRKTWPMFRGSHQADVVVIGGGLTGATCAYVLAAAGLDVMLLEGERVAGGTTGGGLGVIVPEPDAWFLTVNDLTGRRVSRTAWKEARHSATGMAALLEKLNIKCDLASSPLLINARGAEAAADLRKEQAGRRDAGLAATWLKPQAVAAASALESSGAIRLGEAFTFDPVRAAIGLVSAAESKGARVFERSAVRRTRFTRKYADVFLASGSIRTQGVIVATGEPGALFGQLRRHVRRDLGAVVVTEPLTAAMRREAGDRDTVVTEAVAADRRWLRWLAEDRALFAGAVTAPGTARARDRILVQKTAQLMYELSVRYPAISGLPAHWGWETPVTTTADGLPWIGPHRNFPFHFFAMAFGWHGDGLAWFAARAALRYFRQESRRDDDAFGFNR
jgi:glycine/D-amino acid oxidase-like deaminating enzyme